MTAPTPEEQHAMLRALLVERRARLYGQARFTANTRRNTLALIRETRKETQ